ncbi:hypothetical protein [Roseiflexus castenholzii]|uniref:hypothetical protein n=1 Tax=Roseiflexus castenholzii TaxID=120962 RepID=UPI0002F578F6|nr:hypothetical protein [Roseiflexus castenholzii]
MVTGHWYEQQQVFGVEREGASAFIDRPRLEAPVQPVARLMVSEQAPVSALRRRCSWVVARYGREVCHGLRIVIR